MRYSKLVQSPASPREKRSNIFEQKMYTVQCKITVHEINYQPTRKELYWNSLSFCEIF